MESAAKGAEMAVEAVNRIGKYSYKTIRSNPKQLINKQELTCYNCGFNVAVTHIKRHIRQECTARASKCKKCGKTGHFARVCKQRLPEDVQQIEPSDFKEENTNDTGDQNLYNINIFRIKASKNRVQPILKSNIVNKKNFRVQVVINNCLDSPIADTGAKVSVCGTAQAKRWNLLNRIVPSTVKLKP